MDYEENNDVEIQYESEEEIIESMIEVPEPPPQAPPPPPHEILAAAQQMLGHQPPAPQALVAYSSPEFKPIHLPDSYSPPPVNFDNIQVFPEVTEPLRNEEGVDLFRIKRLNLAAAVEALERALKAQESFPSADASIAVAKLSQQVNDLTKEVERSTDPYKLFDRILSEVLEPLTRETIRALGEEGKWLIGQFEYKIPTEQRKAFADTVKAAVSRVGPTLSESLELSKERLQLALNIKKERK